MAFLLVLALALLLPARASGASPEWVPPLDGALVVARAFDPPSVRWGAGHRGVDLAAFVGAPVYAAGPGTVTYAGVLAGRGVVTVTHGELRTTYEPLTPLVEAGDHVGAGEVLGLLDAGHEDVLPPDALLHWGLLRDETYLDPLLLLRRGPSRLVPVAPAGAALGAAGARAAAVPAPAEPAPAEPDPAEPAPAEPVAGRPAGDRRAFGPDVARAVTMAAPLAAVALAVRPRRRAAGRPP